MNPREPHAPAAPVSTLEEQRVPITGIGDALRNLWRRASAEDPQLPLHRALTMNFIAVTDTAHEPQLQEVLERILIRHPCRAFLVLLDEEVHGLQATVASQIRTLGASRVTVLEMVHLRSTDEQLAKVPGIVRSMLVNDIHTHLFWQRPVPRDTGLLAELAELADQVVVDSAEFADPAKDMTRLRHLEGPRLVDLVWFRLAPWRRALAEAFETFSWAPTPATHATIRHGGAAAPSQALARWLEEKLKAKVKVKAVADEAPEREPLALEVEWGDVHVLVEHLVEEPRLRVTTTRGDHCLLPFLRPASRGRQGDLLAAALDLA